MMLGLGLECRYIGQRCAGEVIHLSNRYPLLREFRIDLNYVLKKKQHPLFPA